MAAAHRRRRVAFDLAGVLEMSLDDIESQPETSLQHLKCGWSW